ncbi:glycosyltransferase [Marinobacter sp. AN1]|uniref:glycosyltransferase n=1 Tax=Marinobacter sp. AN1 TaxID=2886046 RepID=UPI00222E1157|nr:glycosyltransferase [Marinobacter sp. AN1]UZD66507.1 glycosyltransferase [Marinobacter sp. AN1]
MMMLDAFFEINRNYKDIWLLMVGDGPAGSLLKRRVQELQIGHRVIFTGFKATPFRYLCAMDIFLLSSHTEGTSMTLLEAMSIGIPAVVTSVGGNPEILEDNATGLLTPSDDHHRFAEAIRYLVENPDIANKMGSSANKVFHKNFAVENMLSAYMQTYHAIISNSI